MFSPILSLAASLYFFYKLKAQTSNRGGYGFGAGIFLVIFIYKVAPVVAKLYLKNFL